MNIEGSLIRAKALFCFRALFGATRIQGLALSLGRSRVTYPQKSDFSVTRSRQFRRGNLGTIVPQDENLPTCAPSGLRPQTYHILGRQH